MLTWLCGVARNVWLKYLRKHQDYISLDEGIIGQMEVPEKET
jgi:DNA-directed RNA polymerase specialized sigma24 family protein